MINITKYETELIKKYFPYVHIRRTVHRHYMTENKKAVEFLKGYNESSSKTKG